MARLAQQAVYRSGTDTGGERILEDQVLATEDKLNTFISLLAVKDGATKFNSVCFKCHRVVRNSKTSKQNLNANRRVLKLCVYCTNNVPSKGCLKIILLVNYLWVLPYAQTIINELAMIHYKHFKLLLHLERELYIQNKA